MDIVFKTRPLYPDEQRLLKIFRAQREKESGSKIKFHHFLVAGISGAGLTYLASIIKGGFWVFLFGTLAVFAFAFIVFTPFEIYKMRRRHKDFLKSLDAIIDKGTVDTCLVNATRIALAKEYEDEGDLYIVEWEANKILYLWDYDYNLRKKLPCLDFEIYEENFFKLFGRQVYPLSDRITPLAIDKKAKWKYMSKNAPGHLQIDSTSFDKVIEEINSYA